MQADEIADLLVRPDFLHRLLGDYSGAYSIGVGQDPADLSRPAIILHLEHQSSEFKVPEAVTVGGETLKVITKAGFVPAQPL